MSICTQNEASDFPQSILLYTENLMPKRITYLTWVQTHLKCIKLYLVNVHMKSMDFMYYFLCRL